MLKKNLLFLAATLWIGGFSVNAHAVIIELNFSDLADATGDPGTGSPYGEQGIEASEKFNFDGVIVTATANSTYLPYLDEGNAGLGVCKVVNGNDQCDPSSDDNVTNGEWLQLAFEGVQVTSGMFIFRDANHNLVDPLDTYLIAYDWVGTTFAEFAMDANRTTFDTALTGPFSSVTFGYDSTSGGRPDQFYLHGSVDVNVVPLPGTLALLLGGLGAIGAVKLRKRKFETA